MSINRNEFIDRLEECNVLPLNFLFKYSFSNIGPNSNMATGIMMLNDYCLLEIFQYLSVLDLANFKSICADIGAIADREFDKKTRGSLDFDYDHSMADVLQIIGQFGQFVRDLSITCNSLGDTKWNDIFTAIKKHCKQTLRKLGLRGDALVYMTAADVSLIADVLKNVETLDLVANVVYPQELLLAQCENVKSVTLLSETDVNLDPTIFQNNKHLQQLTLCGRSKDSDVRTLINNVMNTRLEELYLKLTGRHFYEGPMELIRLKYLKRLKHLKRLTIYSCFNVGISPLLQSVNTSLDSLTALTLMNAQLNGNDIESLGRLTRVTYLKLGFCTMAANIHFDALLILCGNKHFERLVLACYKIVVNKANFSRLIQKRKASAAVNCLHVTLNRSIYTASLEATPAALFAANADTIKLMDHNNGCSLFEHFVK